MRADSAASFSLVGFSSGRGGGIVAVGDGARFAARERGAGRGFGFGVLAISWLVVVVGWWS